MDEGKPYPPFIPGLPRPKPDWKWKTVMDPRSRPDHVTFNSFVEWGDTKPPELRPCSAGVTVADCWKCGQSFAFVNGDSECPGCGALSAANVGWFHA